MNWKLRHKLFGTDFVYIVNSATSMVCKIITAPNGSLLFKPYSFQLNIVPDSIPLEGIMVNGWSVVPLTPNITE